MSILDAPITPASIGALPFWKASTAYTSGQLVISPAGEIVSAKTSFTSGSSYDATKWNPNTVYATQSALSGAIDASGGTPPAAASLIPPKPQKQMIQTFQSGHGWAAVNDSGVVTNLNDTADYAVGSQSVKIVTNGTNGGATIYKYGTTAVDFTNKNVAVLIKFDNSTHNRGVTIQLGSTGTMSANYQFNPVNLAGTDQPVGPDGQYNWHVIPWNPTVVTGSPNRAAITDFSIRVTDDNTGNLVTAHVQAIAAVPIPSVWTNGCVSFDLDDGFASHYTSARPILGKYGYAANLYPVCEAVDSGAGYMTTTQVQELQNVYGWSVGAHSDTWAHHGMALSAQTSDELALFVKANRKWLADRGLRGFDFFAYPGGIDSGPNLAIARQYYATARTVNQRTRETLPAGDHHRLRIYLMDASKSVANIQAEIDAAYSGNYHLILVAHDMVASGATSGTILTSTFSSVVDYVASKGMPVKTIQQVLGTR